MKEPKDALQPETIDHVIESGALSQDHQTNRLVQQLHASAHRYAQENEQSLDRIWSRIVQSQPHSFSLQESWRQPEEKVISMQERKAREESSVSWATNFPTTLVQPKKRSPLLRVVSIGLIAAVVIITIVSFTIFSGVLQSAPQTTSNQTTSTGSQNHPQQQKVITTGKQVCSLSTGSQGSLKETSGSAELGWSSQGQLAVTTPQGIKVYATKNCSTTSFSQPQIQQADGPVWSPDGNKLFVSSGNAGVNMYILDSTGKIITRLNFPAGVNSRVWSPDNTLVINSLDAHDQNNVKESINIVTNNGNKVTTTLLPEGVVVGLSANGKLALVEHIQANNLTVWDINAEKQAGNASFPVATSDAQLSPDGSQLALANEGNIKIYNTTDGKLLTTFEHKVTGYDTHTLAWSPDGKYLAEGADTIAIYDVTAKKLATTLGTSNDQDRITNLTWSPDSTGIASSTKTMDDNQSSGVTVKIWQLS